MWVLYALLSAFFAASTDPIAKRILSKTGDEYLVGWFSILLSTPFLGIYFFSNKIAPVSPELIRIIILYVLPFEFFTAFLYYRALKLTDISLSVPFLALTPVFVVFTGLLFLGERIRPVGIAGIILITIGVYSINIKEARTSLAHPIKAIFANKGSRLMVLVAAIFSVTAVLSKKVMLLSSPQSIPFIYNLSIGLALTPLVAYRIRKGASAVSKDRGIILSYIAMGFLAAFSSIFYFKSISMASVAYAISIKRMSLLMSVGYGWLFFRERDIRIRFVSTLCMVLGVALILISS
ncbi:MAG: DMT family transporter [Candidatus Omnitrophica bacterium]|nr:DMT family transporter [Candidatus Omnitrophota bacterium]